MNVEGLVKLNLDELETELEKGSFSKSLLDSLLEAEKAGKDRSGAVELIEDAILELTEGAEPVELDKIVVAKGKSIGFRAGIKVAGEAVDPSWPEFKANSKLLDEMLKNGLLVKKSEPVE